MAEPAAVRSPPNTPTSTSSTLLHPPASPATTPRRRSPRRHSHTHTPTPVRTSVELPPGIPVSTLIGRSGATVRAIGAATGARGFVDEARLKVFLAGARGAVHAASSAWQAAIEVALVGVDGVTWPGWEAAVGTTEVDSGPLAEMPAAGLPLAASDVAVTADEDEAGVLIGPPSVAADSSFAASPPPSPASSPRLAGLPVGGPTWAGPSGVPPMLSLVDGRLVEVATPGLMMSALVAGIGASPLNTVKLYAHLGAGSPRRGATGPPTLPRHAWHRAHLHAKTVLGWSSAGRQERLHVTVADATAGGATTVLTLVLASPSAGGGVANLAASAVDGLAAVIGVLGAAAGGGGVGVGGPMWETPLALGVRRGGC
ncbi:hypothetical protein I4F81_010663 [Pyropia yezoensis]|uniref:Uncharacterized protein n=1 Tax=Pyropia yezoensis TaxID=2788 RepID=A0ACC3CDC1_PYRYE|nr:hypothetical protein I4F81_010663 [Neopyropia yezoensis]